MGETAHVERWNNSLRQRLGRLVHRTLSFSKSDVYHEAALKLFIHEYNGAYWWKITGNYGRSSVVTA
ncbi:MAG: hypothetical protein GY803_09555, partial [Chloroflexi bacterium]|nr:hypothetical protein [Chloroflexota bacterium]